MSWIISNMNRETEILEKATKNMGDKKGTGKGKGRVVENTLESDGNGIDRNTILSLLQSANIA